MPNSIGPTGLQVATRDELLAQYTAAFQAIYGADINLDQDTPDGQMIGIFIQSVLDLEDLLVQIYNMFDPDNAVGVVLDQRVAINGIQRQAGTYTLTPITIVTTQACNLYGLDQDVQPVYTVQDNAGNKWLLQTTQLISGAGTTVATFRAEFPGQNFTIPNTITIPVTIVLGVATVNNPTLYTTLGMNEESDAELKVRRQKSVSLASQGYLAGLLAALENINGVTSAFVYENNTSLTDSDGVPGHSIWVIVSGTGTDAEIANAIYSKRNAGCGMKGSTTYTVTQVDGSPFVVRWDTVLPENLFIVFQVSSINGTDVPNIAAIRPGLVSSFVPGVNEEININGLATDVQAIDPNSLVMNAGFSDGREQTLNLSGVPASGVFKVNYNGNASANINWNDNLATIESKIQAIPGLGAATVTGSLAGQQLVVDLSGIGGVISTLLTITDNTLETSGPAAIDITLDIDPQPTLTPSTKQYQFVVSEENIIITPMELLPEASVVLTGGSKQLAAYGGYGEYVYSIDTDGSGGASVDSNGLYTAGPNPGLDIVKVTDALGNTAVAEVTVT